MQPQHRHAHRATLRIVLVLARLQRDVVAEPLRLLVRVGVAADVDQQRRVVDDRRAALVEPEPSASRRRDQALPQHVLHRLAEAEVDAERQRGHELGQPQRPPGAMFGHRAPASSCADATPGVVSHGSRARDDPAGHPPPRSSGRGADPGLDVRRTVGAELLLQVSCAVSVQATRGRGAYPQWVPMRRARRRCSASCGVDLVDFGERVADAGADGFAGSFGLVAEPACSPTQSGGGGEVVDQCGAFGAELLGSCGAAGVLGVLDLVGEGARAGLLNCALAVSSRIGSAPVAGKVAADAG